MQQRLTLPTRQLSGGERMKLLLLILALQPYAPFLLLDEPDNHSGFSGVGYAQKLFTELSWRVLCW